MAFTPQSKVHLCNVPFDKLNTHVLRFDNANLQMDYFAGKTVATLTDYTYQRRESVIRCDLHIDSLVNANYVFYQNTNYTNKWFYAFITKFEYVSDTRTDIHIETDVFQTWFFDLTFKQSFVVREHIASDTVGANVIDEGLFFGDSVLEDISFSDLSDLCILVASTVENNTPYADVVGGLVGGIYQGCKVYYYENTSAGATALNSFLTGLTGAGKADAIVYMVTYSKKLVYVSGMVNGSQVPYNAISATRHTLTFSKKQSGAFTDVDGSTYTPKNKKLYCYPYNSLIGTNNQGGTIDLKYELFGSSNVNFDIQGDIGSNPTVLAIPMYYLGTNFPLDYGLTMKHYNLCSWNTDVFKNWAGQNMPSIVLGAVTSAGALLGGLITMNPILAGGGALAVANQFGQAMEKMVIPPNYRGGNNGGSNCSFGKQQFEFYNSHIRNEFFRKLDDYFEQFGYKTNEVKQPNLTTRPYWNYVKLIDPNIIGDIPSDDMTKIKALFERGLTLWHTQNGFLDYSLNNH